MESTTFADLGLSTKVLASITDAGYTIPTPIQAQAIPVAMTGRDVLGIAQTGTGKTAAFTLPMISRLESGRARARMPRSLILAPTRELAAQVAQAFEKYGVNHKLSVALLIGGVSMDDQVAKLDRGADVLIATPGRLLDHFGRGRVMLMGVEILVIDEADRMLDMGFIPDIEKICKLLPPRRQTLFFSATMPPEITRLVDQFLNQPTRVEVARPATTAATITQRFLLCRNGEDWAKREALRDLIRSQENIKNAIIFCNRKRDVAILHKSLVKHGFNAGALHGDMDQMSRTATLDKFRNNELQLLAASDVAARGLDIPDVSHVFNFDVPWQGDDYVHRIGRTGRAGREGFSATLVTFDDFRALKEIEKITAEASVWLGDEPTAEELAEGATRKRRRGAAPSSAGRSGAGRGDAGRGDSGRGGSGRSDDRRRGGGNRAPDDRGRPPRRDEPRDGGREPVRTDAADAGGLDAAERLTTGDTAAQPVEDNGTRVRSRSRRRSSDRGGERGGERGRGPRPPFAASVVAGAGEQPSVEPAGDGASAVPAAPRSDDRPREEGRREGGRESRRPPREPRGDRGRGREDGGRQPREARPAETQEPREPRQQAPRRDEQRRDEPRRDEPRRTEPRRNEPRQADQPSSEPRRPQPERQDGDRRDRRPQRRDDSGPRVGFEDNIPAFLRRPARPDRQS